MILQRLKKDFVLKKIFSPLYSNDVVGYSNRMAFPEGGDDNISQHMGSTVHDDDFQEALNMISDDIDDKAKFAVGFWHKYCFQ